MTKEEMFALMNKTMTMQLATVEGDQPHVRGMLLYKADESGIIFHTGDFKDVYRQIQANPKAEICFFNEGTQVRVKGVLVQDDDPKLREEIYAHPSRKFLQSWKESGASFQFIVFRMIHCEATSWTFADNFSKTEWTKITE